ncbi:MAG: phosphotransferase [Myxococcota bacterium]
MNEPLPFLANEAALDRWLSDGQAVHHGLVSAARQLGRTEDPERFSRGSLPVAAFGDVVIKLFPHFEEDLAETERGCLAALEGALPVPTPGLIEHRSLPGWHVVVMERLRGVELADRWPTLPLDARLDLARQVGECAVALHRQAAPASVPQIEWSAWVDERKPLVVARQRERGAPAWLLDSLDSFVATADLSEGPRGRGWLHTELMLEHLLAEPTDQGQWRLSGLFDFEPSMVAPVDYEWSSLGLFVARGEANVWRAVLKGLGVASTPDVPLRAFAMALMHRYVNLAWYLRRLPSPHPDLRSVIEAWFGLDAP